MSLLPSTVGTAEKFVSAIYANTGSVQSHTNLIILGMKLQETNMWQLAVHE